MKKKMYFFMVASCLMAGVTGFPIDGEGGQVSTDGVITFYEDEPTTQSSEELVETSTEEPPVTSSTEDTGKLPDTKDPTGKLPATGETILQSAMISGAVLLLIVLGFWLWRRKKASEVEEDAHE